MFSGSSFIRPQMDIASYFTKKEPKVEKMEAVMEKIVIDSVPGLVLIKNFITKAEEDALLADVNKQPWSSKLKRRVQHYGYEYDYTSRNAAAYLGPLPDFLNFVVERISAESLMSQKAEQCIVNEYEPGQGINNHVDVSWFGEEIVSISMGSDAVMDFTHSENKSVKLLLPRRSLLLLEGEARHKWKHGIAARKKDQLDDGTVLLRKKRVSLTFRFMSKK